MKKSLYILAFVFLGFLSQLLAHGIIENFYIKLLVSDFAFYGFGLNWENWFYIHKVLTIVFALSGTLLGLWQGFYWWPRLYDPDGRRRKFLKA